MSANDSLEEDVFEDEPQDDISDLASEAPSDAGSLASLGSEAPSTVSAPARLERKRVEPRGQEGDYEEEEPPRVAPRSRGRGRPPAITGFPRCPWILTRGIREGQACSGPGKCPEGFCVKHLLTGLAKLEGGGSSEGHYRPKRQEMPIEPDSLEPSGQRRGVKPKKGKLKDTVQDWGSSDVTMGADQFMNMLSIYEEINAAKEAAMASGGSSKRFKQRATDARRGEPEGDVEPDQKTVKSPKEKGVKEKVVKEKVEPVKVDDKKAPSKAPVKPSAFGGNR